MQKGDAKAFLKSLADQSIRPQLLRQDRRTGRNNWNRGTNGLAALAFFSYLCLVTMIALYMLARPGTPMSGSCEESPEFCP